MTTHRQAKKPWLAAGVPAAVADVAVLLTGALLSGSGSTPPLISALDSNPDIDRGTQLPRRPAPGFDQFGRGVSLSSFAGEVVILSFNDSQ